MTLDDIITRDAAMKPNGNLDAIIQRDAGIKAGVESGAQTAVQNTIQSAPSSMWDEATRQLGLTVRAGINGVTGLPAMVGDALNTGVNKLFGTHLQPVSQTIGQLENKAGLPQPRNATERVVQDVAGSMASVPGSILAAKPFTQMASPVVSAVSQAIQDMPGMQIIGAGGSGAGTGIARENGVGPVGQLVAGFGGGITGAVAPSLAIAGARMAARTPANIAGAVQPFTNPQKYVGTQLANHLGEDAPLVAQNIRSAPEFVPGSLPTTAQAGQTPTLVATEKSLANSHPPFKIGLAERGADNNNARWQVLNDVAQTPEVLDAARTAREAAAGPLYDAAHQNTANVGKAFVSFAQRPAVMQAMQHADQLARNEGVTLKWPTPQDRAISGQALDYTSRALSDLIDSAKRSGNNQQVRALTEAQNYLQGWTAQYVPGVRQAAQVYAEHSVPVNTMEAGQQIANTLGTRSMNGTGIPQIELGPYRTAMMQAVKGQKYGIDPAALTKLQGIGQDLQRATVSNSLRSPGSDTAYNITANGWLGRQLYGSNFEGAGRAARGVGAIGAFLTGHPMVGAGILGGGKKLGSLAAERLNAELSDLMLNPTGLLPYLDAVRSLPQNTGPLLPGSLGRNVNYGLLGSAVSSGSDR